MDWQVKELIDKQPTVDAVEVIYGKWISDYDGFEWSVRCSVCGEEVFSDVKDFKYCPYCGANMDGEEKKDE